MVNIISGCGLLGLLVKLWLLGRLIDEVLQLFYIVQACSRCFFDYFIILKTRNEPKTKMINLPRIVKFLINYLTSGEKNLRHVGHVRMFEVRRSIRQIWQNVCPHSKIRGILSLSLQVSQQIGQLISMISNYFYIKYYIKRT